MKSAIEARVQVDTVVDATLKLVDDMVGEASRKGEFRVNSVTKLTGKQIFRLRELGYKVTSTRSRDGISWKPFKPQIT
jgi:hypothetical protein